jgi:hypothetical protein
MPSYTHEKINNDPALWRFVVHSIVEIYFKKGITPRMDSDNEHENFSANWLKYQRTHLFGGSSQNRVEWVEIIEKYNHCIYFDKKSWRRYKNDLIDYFKNNKHLTDKKLLAEWTREQVSDYRNSRLEITLKDEWVEFYKEYFLDIHLLIDEDIIKSWREMRDNLVEKYLDHGNIPDKNSNGIIEKYLGIWLSIQPEKYKTNRRNSENQILVNEWEELCKTYKFIPSIWSNASIWRNQKDIAEAYFNKIASCGESTRQQIKLWVSKQKSDFLTYENDMSNKELRDEWELFTDKYVLASRVNTWMKNKLEYIKRRENNNFQDEIGKRLIVWAKIQQQNYESYTRLMKDQHIRSEWEKICSTFEKITTRSSKRKSTNIHEEFCKKIKIN